MTGYESVTNCTTSRSGLRSIHPASTHPTTHLSIVLLSFIHSSIHTPLPVRPSIHLLFRSLARFFCVFFFICIFQYIYFCFSHTFNLQVKFINYRGQIKRPDLPQKRNQSPWSVFGAIEWDGKVFKEGQLVSVQAYQSKPRKTLGSLLCSHPSAPGLLLMNVLTLDGILYSRVGTFPCLS